VVGTPLALPFLLGPIGSTRMFYPHGEAVAAQAAGAAGTAYTLSTLSGSTLEEVRAASTGPLWYQLYLVGGHDVAKKTICAGGRGGLLGARRHNRHARGRPSRARRAQRHERAAHAAASGRCCRSCRSSSPGRDGWPGSCPTAG